MLNYWQARVLVEVSGMFLANLAKSLLHWLQRLLPWLCSRAVTRGLELYQASLWKSPGWTDDDISALDHQ
jgi:hypothetical protein